jgi:hypothetical protein
MTIFHRAKRKDNKVMTNWDELQRDAAKEANKKLEAQRMAVYQSQLITDPVREMHETLRDIRSLLNEILEEIKKSKNG